MGESSDAGPYINAHRCTWHPLPFRSVHRHFGPPGEDGSVTCHLYKTTKQANKTCGLSPACEPEH